jgi:hypothetical protein
MKRARYKDKMTHRCGACNKKFGSGNELAEHLQTCNRAAVLTEILETSMDIVIDRKRSRA